MIIMGKYDYNETQDNPLKFECYIKTAIANELAEANRLKRLEMRDRLRVNYGHPEESFNKLNEELEDKA